MYRATHSLCRLRRASSLPDFFWLLLMFILLLAILLPSQARSRELAKRAVCASNLRGLGMAMHIYADDYAEWFPHHYYAEPTEPGARQQSVAVRWVGTMGSNEFLKITERTTPKVSPDRNHVSRSLFLLVIGGSASPKQFICPSSGDIEDNLRNFSESREIPAQSGVNRFDFRGYPYLSYGYQLPFGTLGKPRAGMDPRMAIAADKGPYSCAGGPGLAGSGTIRDRRSDTAVPTDWSAREALKILETPSDTWRPYNSRSHRSEGQNVLFADAHVEFCRRPVAGVGYDNIYTLQADYTLPAAMIGIVPDAEHPLGPLANTDSFIVP